MWRDLTSDGYSEKFAELDDEYRVVDFDAYPTADGIRYAAIWHDNRKPVPVAP